MDTLTRSITISNTFLTRLSWAADLLRIHLKQLDSTLNESNRIQRLLQNFSSTYQDTGVATLDLEPVLESALNATWASSASKLTLWKLEFSTHPATLLLLRCIQQYSKAWSIICSLGPWIFMALEMYRGFSHNASCLINVRDKKNLKVLMLSCRFSSCLEVCLDFILPLFLVESSLGKTLAYSYCLFKLHDLQQRWNLFRLKRETREQCSEKTWSHSLWGEILRSTLVDYVWVNKVQDSRWKGLFYESFLLPYSLGADGISNKDGYNTQKITTWSVHGTTLIQCTTLIR